VSAQVDRGSPHVRPAGHFRHLPAGLAGHTRPIFGTLYGSGILITLARWLQSAG
jgi:hypothetical protein